MLSDEWAKAAQELAKTCGKGIDAARELGGFIGQVFEGSTKQIGGIAEDWLFARRMTLRDRWDRLDRLKTGTQQSLSKRGVKGATRAVPPKLALSIFEEAILEDDDSLQDIWARLLATAMDPKAPEIKRSFIEIVQQLEHDDVAVFDFLHQITFKEDQRVMSNRLGDGSFTFALSELSALLNRPGGECEVSLLNLDRLGCIILQLQLDVGKIEGYAQTKRVHIRLTRLGEELIAACTN